MAQPLSPDQLRAVLEQTLSPHYDTRKSAEDHLSRAQKITGHPLTVLRLVEAEPNVAIRQAAAVHFKNVVKNGWNAHNENEIVISEQDRRLIKDNLVQLMSTVPPNIQSQCSESISLIAAVDFPDRWDNLLPMLVQKFGSDDPAIVNGVLLTANSIFKRFRYSQRSDALYKDILYSLPHVQEPLLALFKKTTAAVDGYQNDAAQLAPRMQTLRLIARIFFSLTYQDLPEYFEDHMPEWMEEFAKYLNYQNPLLTDEDEELEPGPIDKLQSAIVEILNLFADKDEEPFLPFLPQFTQLVWNLLLRVTILSKHDVLATKCIRFLSSLVKKQMHKDLFKDEATLRQIIGNIVVPNLAIREVDQERFEDDPAEFLATDLEASESESRRRCSQDLLRSMCRQFEQQTTVICYEHVGNMLQEYAANPAERWTSKDTAIHLMFGISIKAESSFHGVSQVNDEAKLMAFFSEHVFSELQDANHGVRPMLKSTAIKFVSTFRNQFTKEQLVALMPLLITHLASPVVVVHTYAAYTIEKILTTKTALPGELGTQPMLVKFGRADLNPFLETIFTAMFSIIDNTTANENEYAMKCVMRTLSVAKEDIIPATGIVLDKLKTALARVATNPRNPHFNHYLFESIAVLIKSVCQQQPEATAAFEHNLFEPFEAILTRDVSEFTPYVFQIFAQLLEFHPPNAPLGDGYSSLLPGCLNPLAWERSGNIPALTRLLRAYLQEAPTVMGNDKHFRPLLGVWQKLISSKANEQNSFDLLTSVVHHIPLATLQTVMTTILSVMFTRLQNTKTVKFTRLITDFFALFAGIFGSQAFFDQLNSVQAGMGLKVLMQVWLPRLSSDAPMRLEAKMHVVALTKLSCDSPALVSDPSTKQLWGQLIAAIVFLLSSPEMGQVQADDSPQEVEITYDSAYSGLHFARRAKQDHFASVVDPALTFVQALHHLSISQPGQLQPIIQQALGSDAKLSVGLQTMLRKNGVALV